jgi:hypothetical protein
VRPFCFPAAYAGNSQSAQKARCAKIKFVNIGLFMGQSLKFLDLL